MKIEDLTLKQIKEICKKQVIAYRHNKETWVNQCAKCPCLHFCYLYFYKSDGTGIAPWVDWESEEMEREVISNEISN